MHSINFTEVALQSFFDSEGTEGISKRHGIQMAKFAVPVMILFIDKSCWAYDCSYLRSRNEPGCEVSSRCSFISSSLKLPAGQIIIVGVRVPGNGEALDLGSRNSEECKIT